MANHNLFFVLLVSFAIGSTLKASADTCPYSPKKLFVFGDSYLDTGNLPHNATCWKAPYGISLGKPNGRQSDGYVLTDYLAQFMGIHTLKPYSRVNASNKASTLNGVNFAVGGSSLLLNPECDLKNSIAFVSASINDYFAYYRHFGFPYAPLSAAVIAQMKANLQLLYTFGIGKIAVASLPPVGCLPDSAEDRGGCIQALNDGARSHNEALRVVVDGLNEGNKEKIVEIVDFYGAFSAAMDEQEKIENKDYSDPTKRCCENCEQPGAYTVCDNPSLAFFWDGAHPAQHGWQLVFNKLKEQLYRLVA